MKENVILILLSVVSLYSYAQSPLFTVRGQVFDSISGAALENATISFYRLPEMVLLSRERNGKEGFKINSSIDGLYNLVITHIGFLPDTILLFAVAGEGFKKSLRVLLKPLSEELSQVVVRTGLRPAILHNDTLIFNEAAFSTRPNATLEDLLRKMPGIEIDKDGNITIQGQKVDKIYIDGKEFFLQDLRTATQNLPADLVARIEAFNTETEKERMIGIQSIPGSKTIDIRLKKDKKQGYFGNIYAGVGNNEIYSAGGRIGSLGTKQLLFGSFNANNINNQFTGEENANGSGPGGIQNFSSSNLNYRDDWGSKIKGVVNGSYRRVQTSMIQNIERKTFLPDSILEETRLTNMNSINKDAHLNSIVEYDIDSSNIFIFKSDYTAQMSKSMSQDTASINIRKQYSSYLSNREKSIVSSNSNSESFVNSFDFVHKYHKNGRKLYLGLVGSSQINHLPGSIYSIVEASDSSGKKLEDSLINQEYTQVINAENYSADINYSGFLHSRHYFELNYSFNSTGNKSNKNSFNLNGITGKFDIPDSLTSSHLNTQSTIHQVSAGVHCLGNKFNYQLELMDQFSNFSDINTSIGTKLTRRYMTLIPHISLSYAINSRKNIQMFYSAFTVAPTIDQLQPVPDLTNPFRWTLGNPKLDQQIDKIASISYVSLSEQSTSNLQIQLHEESIDRKIASSTVLLAGGIQQIKYENVSGNFNIGSSIAYGFPLGKSKKSNGSVNISGQYIKDISLVNNLENASRSILLGIGVKFNYHPIDKLFADALCNLSFAKSVLDLNVNQDNNSLTENINLAISYEFLNNYTIYSTYILQVIGNQSQPPVQISRLWNFSISKGLLRKSILEVKLSLFDILNSLDNYSQSIVQNYIQNTRSNLPGRLVLLSCVYHFTKFRI